MVLVGSNFNAEYGHTGGGFEIFTTKSGTNEFHGAAFDYLRNNVFDARGFFSPVTPVNRQNEYGVAFGGPVWIPKLYNGRNRTFFHDGKFPTPVVPPILSLQPRTQEV